MKRLPLSGDDRLFLKSIEGDPAMVLLLMLKMYPTPVNADNLTFEMKWDSRKNRAKTALDYLASDGFTALVKGQGYILTGPAMRRVVEFFEPILMLQVNGEALGSGNAQAQSPVLEAGTEADDNNTLIVLQDESQLNMSTQNARALKKEEEEILRIKSHESTSSDLSTQNARTLEIAPLEIAPGVTTERILLASSSLEGFGEGVFLQGLDHANIHPRMALGWIAQAYTERGRLESPAGLVYSRLKDVKEPKPRVKYYDGWESFLPDEFLQVIGLLELTCRACDQTFETVEAFKEHQALTMKCELGCGATFHRMEDLEAHHMTHTPNVDVYILLDDESRGAKAWQMVKAELAVDIPKASFDTWVKDADAVGFEAGQLMVCVRNAYARDWLTDRLTSKIEAMLKNFTHEPIKVRFVVGVVDVEEANDSE